MTIAVLMYHSGRIAVLIESANLGKPFPTTSPATKARRNPASDVKFNDQWTPKLFNVSGVAAMYA